ncbi:MAG TPA: metallophosphoesterase family protein [Actinomycetota bacterium]|nr:metallophosphoesterase family protein [Actinomycetota bacterium]
MTADTHVPDFARALPDALLRAAADVDLVVHAGDVTAPAVLEELRVDAEVVVAAGNNDGPAIRSWGARDELVLDLDGVPTAVVHDAGPRKGRARRMRRRFPDARLVVYGHSHIPLDEDDGDLRLLNPGSPTWKRREPAPTFAILTIADGRVDAELVAVEAAAR